MEQVEELAKSQIFTPAEARALVPMPDVDAMLGKQLDVKGIYRKQIASAIDEGTYSRPEAFWPELDTTGKQLYSEAIFENQSAGVADDRLQILRDWLIAANDLVNPPPDPNAPPPMPATPPAPQGAPVQ